MSEERPNSCHGYSCQWHPPLSMRMSASPYIEASGRRTLTGRSGHLAAGGAMNDEPSRLTEHRKFNRDPHRVLSIALIDSVVA